MMERSSGDTISRAAVPAALASATCAVSVPARNHSVRGASSCASKMMACATRPGGGTGAAGTQAALIDAPGRGDDGPMRPGWASATSLRCRASITVRHTGAAPVTPETACIGAPPALPTHTPTV